MLWHRFDNANGNKTIPREYEEITQIINDFIKLITLIIDAHSSSLSTCHFRLTTTFHFEIYAFKREKKTGYDERVKRNGMFE